MRFIQKHQEPSEFDTWKQQSNADWQPNWENFQKPEKITVHNALLEEQGYICCYCGQLIDRATSHIEHFQPRTHYPELSLSYGNFLASCPGYPTDENPQTQPPKLPQEFCGQKKGAWYETDLTVSPLDRDCTSYFRYTEVGEILPTKETPKAKAAGVTIQELGLNHAVLTLSRKRIIDGVLQNIESLTTQEIQQLIDLYDRPDTSGKFTPFCAAIIYRLQAELNFRPNNPSK
jgi:uncharacterized protein (TIGR02646 family)